MVIIDHLDLTTKRIYLATNVREYHPIDLYKEIRQLRHTNETMRGFDVPVVAAGNVPKGGGKFTPRYATFRMGWKVVPEDTSHVLYVSGEQITDGGEAGPACIDFTPLSESSKVVVQYEPPSAEIIEVETGSGVTQQDKIDIASLSWDELLNNHTTTGTVGDALRATRALAIGRWRIDPADKTMTIYDIDNETPIIRLKYLDEKGNPTLEGIYERVPI